jgi:hypothetical protein
MGEPDARAKRRRRWAWGITDAGGGRLVGLAKFHAFLRYLAGESKKENDSQAAEPACNLLLRN